MEKSILSKLASYPLEIGRKLNVHKTFRRRPGRLLDVLCTFNLRPVSRRYGLNILLTFLKHANEQCIFQKQPQEMFYKKGVLKTFTKFAGEQLC